MVTQGSADASAEGLDGYDIVASARIVGKDLCLIEDYVEANIFNVGLSRLTDLLVGCGKAYWHSGYRQIDDASVPTMMQTYYRLASSISCANASKAPNSLAKLSIV